MFNFNDKPKNNKHFSDLLKLYKEGKLNIENCTKEERDYIEQHKSTVVNL